VTAIQPRRAEPRERKVNPEERDSRLAAATTAARRLLVRAIDVRFALDEATETMDGDGGPTVQDMHQLRTDARALQHEVECLCRALWPRHQGDDGEAEELDDEVVEQLRA
jgi:hypothetical protein